MTRASEHCSDEDLLLEYYGEASRVSHLSACADCTLAMSTSPSFRMGTEGQAMRQV